MYKLCSSLADILYSLCPPKVYKTVQLRLSIGRYSQLPASIYKKMWRFPYQKFSFLSSNIPISQLLRHVLFFCSYGCFILMATRHSNKFFEQGYDKKRLNSSLRKFYDRYGDLIKQYEVPLSWMLNVILLAWQYTLTTLIRSEALTILDLVTEIKLKPNYERFQFKFCYRRGMSTRDAYSSVYLVPSHTGLAYVLLVETNIFPKNPLFFGLLSLYFLRAQLLWI